MKKKAKNEDSPVSPDRPGVYPEIHPEPIVNSDQSTHPGTIDESEDLMEDTDDHHKGKDKAIRSELNKSDEIEITHRDAFGDSSLGVED